MEQVAEIVYTPCTYCGELDVREWRKGKFAQINSIDRVDNTIGYTLENSVSCCKKCNMMKGRMSVKDFTEHIAKLARFLLN